jgi:uncharacterized protein (DUF2252 family)
MSNFGVYATPERHLVFDVNDFDETLPGPWEWDVKRLAASVAVGARSYGLTQYAADEAVFAAVASYRDRLFMYAAMHPLDVWYTRVDVVEAFATFGIRRGLEVASAVTANMIGARQRMVHREIDKLTTVVDGLRRIADDPPLLDHIGPATDADLVARAFAGYLTSLPHELRALLERFRLVDIARKVVGVGSVGTRCWVALLVGDDEDDPLFLQVKEAGRSVLEEALGVRSPFGSHGERVVAGQRVMQAASDIFLGWSTDEPTRLHQYWRQLRDLKWSVDLERLRPKLLANYAAACGWALARSHARLSTAPEIVGYLGRSDAFPEAIAEFASSYADQNDRDYEALLDAVRTGRLPAEIGV